MLRVFLYVFFLSLLSSCSRDIEKICNENESLSVDKHALRVLVNNEFTKASSMSETTVNTIELIVYGIKDGVKTFDTFYHAERVSDFVIYIDKNKDVDSYLFVAYVNYDSFSIVNSLQSYNLENSITNDWVHLSDESLDGFRMYGFVEKTKVDLLSSLGISIDVRRLVSKVSVNTINLNWNNKANNQKDFILKAIYLTDVKGVCEAYNPIPAELSIPWYNPNGHITSSKDEMLYSSLSSVLLNDGSSYSQEHVFYGYISELQNYNDSAQWKEGGTRLVIEAEFGGLTCYYHLKVNPSGIRDCRNCHFRFDNITITRPGAPTPYGEYVEENAIESSVSVVSWNIIDKGELPIE